MDRCADCRHMLKAKTRGVVGCRLLNRMTEGQRGLERQTCPSCGEDVFYDILRGKVYEGWFGGGGMMRKGYVIDSDGLCRKYVRGD